MGWAGTGIKEHLDIGQTRLVPIQLAIRLIGAGEGLDAALGQRRRRGIGWPGKGTLIQPDAATDPATGRRHSGDRRRRTGGGRCGCLSDRCGCGGCSGLGRCWGPARRGRWQLSRRSGRRIGRRGAGRQSGSGSGRQMGGGEGGRAGRRPCGSWQVAQALPPEID